MNRTKVQLADLFQRFIINNIEKYQSLMLGLQSNIEEEAEISSLSLSSQENTATKDQNPSTNYASSCEKQDQSSPYLRFESKSKNSQLASIRARDLRIKLNYLLKIQNNLNSQMNHCVGLLEKEIEAKELQNNQIEDYVVSLKTQIDESRADIVTLSEICNKRKKAFVRNIKQQQTVENPTSNKVIPTLKHLTSHKKVTASPVHSGRMMTQKPGSPKSKGVFKQQTERMKIKLKEDTSRKEEKKTIKITSSSPNRYKKLAKSP